MIPRVEESGKPCMYGIPKIGRIGRIGRIGIIGQTVHVKKK
jgi:hypothetical protein